VSEQLELASRYGMRTEQFSDLMAHRVREILLVASSYDAFVLEEDGELSELLSREYRNLELNIRHAPRFTRADTASRALELLRERTFHMVVTTARLADMPIEKFGRRAKEMHPEISLGVLAAHAWEIPRLIGLREKGSVDWTFLWQGDVKALFAMVAQEEDRRNAEHDVLSSGVQVIVFVEDDVRFISFYLPHIYAEVTRQTTRLMAEGLNLSHRLLRLQARPKILLAQTFEEACAVYERYAGNVLGIISDIGFPRAGELDPEAGLRLAELARERDPDLPVILQSSNASLRRAAHERGAGFVDKQSPASLDDLRRLMLDTFGFGDFVFRLPDGTEVGRAQDVREFISLMERAPEASLEYHAGHNHFSRWFAARTEFELASMLRPRKVSEFATLAELRAHLLRTVVGYLREIQRNIIADFDVERFDEYVAFAKIGVGSLGGKGRGLAFMQRLLAAERVQIPGVEVAVPQTVVLAADEFETFLDRNDLRALAPRADEMTDQQVLDAFRAARFERPVRANLARFLQVVRDPIAVRSSSVLEDSPYQPFAGVYATIMLPNNHPSLDVRLAQLLEAVKVIYASTFMGAARSYLETTPYRLEEQGMGVLLQRLVGRRHGDRFYPLVSGVASSYNYYPFRDMRPEDGVALVALGLGKAVVDGFEALRFCPAYPQVLPQFSSTRDALKAAQRRFWALDASRDDVIPGLEWDANLLHLDVTEAVGDPAAAYVTSTYMRNNDAIVDRTVRGGVPLVTFSRLLKGRALPLGEILTWLLGAVERGMGTPVEIEFALDLRPREDIQVFHVLQVRPMVVEPMGEGEPDGRLDDESAIVASPSALGHGRSRPVRDLVVVLPDLDRARTGEAAMVLERISRELRRRGRPFILIGPGRWGSRDPWLGIPVVWSQISGAVAIVESDFEGFEVEPSQGSHFFHNLTSFGVRFLAVHRQHDHGRIEWGWLAAQPAAEEALDGKVRHLRLATPVEVLVNGAQRRGVVVSSTPATS
jgi:hypothetical protein